jgi:hypothetical protein
MDHGTQRVATFLLRPRRGAAWAMIISLLFVLGQIGFAQQGEEITILFPQGPNKQGKPQPPAKVVCWLPADCKYVRGVVVAHPMIREFATSPLVRKVAAEEGLGTMVMPVFASSGKETMERLDQIFEEWAKLSGHPEIRGAAVFTAGLSASVLWARNVGYAAPDRCFGILHVAGGNLHHAMVDERKTLAGVPFIAMNGEFETCGPEGGIRPHLGLETQWYLMGDTMLERRKQDPNNLMSLVVVPAKGHTAWNIELAALFLRKAAQYHLPKEKRDGATPAKCIPLRAEDGWLTDRNVKYPRYDPAPYADYKGDKTEAFWHFDKEMALAVCKYHRDGIRTGQERTLFRAAGLFEELWPLGQRLDVPFKGNTPAEHTAAIREWINRKAGGRLADVVVAALAEGLAAGVPEDANGKGLDEAAFRHHCQRVCYAHDDLYRPVEEAIEQADLTAAFKDALRAYYAEKLLVGLPAKRIMPELTIGEQQAFVAGIAGDDKLRRIPLGAGFGVAIAQAEEAAVPRLRAAYPPPPEALEKLLGELQHKDIKRGWAAVEEIAKLGPGAIPRLVRLVDYAGPPAEFRAVAALGRLGKVAAAALPDLQRAARRGGTLATKALEAIDEIQKATSP